MDSVIESLGSSRLASRRPRNRHLITNADIYMAILMLYLPPLHFYRNNGSVTMTVFACVLWYLFISLPVFLVELLIGSFSNGSLLRAYNYNRLAKAILCIIVLHQFQNLISGTSNAHKILTFALTFFLQSMNPHVSLWNCGNTWNTDSCCPLLAAMNETAATRKLKARCSTPLEEFYKHYGNILYSGMYVPSSSTYDGGHVAMVVWIILGAFIFMIAQLSLRNGIRCVTFLTTIPCLLLFFVLYLHCFRQPLTGPKIANLIIRSDKFRDDYVFTFAMPNIFQASQMTIAGGYLVVLHCCRKPHRNDSQLKSLITKNLLLLAVVNIAYKMTICMLRHGTMGVVNLMRQRVARLQGSFERETHRDLFEDSKDWIYQTVFEYIEIAYIMRNEFYYKGPFLLFETAAVLHPVLLALGFVGVRVAIYKVTWELVFDSMGFPELLSGPWQVLTRLSMPLSILAVNMAADNDIFRDVLFPKEPYGYAWCSINVAFFLPTFTYATLMQRWDRMGHSLHWRMMEFGLKFKRHLIILGMLAGLHLSFAQIYKNVFKSYFRAVLRSNKVKMKTPRVDHFFAYDTGLFGSPAKRVFSFSGVTANWVLNDVFMALVGCLSVICALLQSGRVLRFLQDNERVMHVIFCKPARCFKYCLEFYFAVMFGNR